VAQKPHQVGKPMDPAPEPFQLLQQRISFAIRPMLDFISNRGWSLAAAALNSIRRQTSWTF
jgi:hypothetical protein